jgi:hypothetical protein
MPTINPQRNPLAVPTTSRPAARVVAFFPANNPQVKLELWPAGDVTRAAADAFREAAAADEGVRVQAFKIDPADTIPAELWFSPSTPAATAAVEARLVTFFTQFSDTPRPPLPDDGEFFGLSFSGPDTAVPFAAAFDLFEGLGLTVLKASGQSFPGTGRSFNFFELRQETRAPNPLPRLLAQLTEFGMERLTPTAFRSLERSEFRFDPQF